MATRIDPTAPPVAPNGAPPVAPPAPPAVQGEEWIKVLDDSRTGEGTVSFKGKGVNSGRVRRLKFVGILANPDDPKPAEIVALVASQDKEKDLAVAIKAKSAGKGGASAIITSSQKVTAEGALAAVKLFYGL